MLDNAQLSTFRQSPETLLGIGSGSGYYSRVYKGQIPGTAVKVSMRLDDAWLAYAMMILSMDDPMPWMPRIFALHIDKTEGKYYAIMELLEEGNQARHPRILGEADEVVGVDARVDTLLALLESTYGTVDGFFIDLHHANWMQRSDGTLIVNDPISDSPVVCIDKRQELAAKSKGRISFA